MDGSLDPLTIWTRVGTIDDIPVLGSRIVTTTGDDIALFRLADDRVLALYDRCPHKAGKLSQGIVHGDSVTCPLHNWVIELETGNAVAPDVGCAHQHQVKLEGSMVLLGIAT